jgi:hypothetical protein
MESIFSFLQHQLSPEELKETKEVLYSISKGHTKEFARNLQLLPDQKNWISHSVSTARIGNCKCGIYTVSQLLSYNFC